MGEQLFYSRLTHLHSSFIKEVEENFGVEKRKKMGQKLKRRIYTS